MKNPTLLLILGLATFAMASTSFASELQEHRQENRQEHRFEHRHPRRDQVLDRVHRQDKRITKEVREGDMTHAQAHALRVDSRSVAVQQRVDAKANGGYITKTQQQSLNQELNSNSQQIGH